MFKTSNDNSNPDEATLIQEIGCSGFVKHVMVYVSILINNLLVKTVFSSYHLRLSLPLFLNCFLIFA